jgi:hypothetical protein
MDQNIPQQNHFGIGGQPQFVQLGVASQFNSMFTNMGVPETPVGGQAVPTDPNEWQLQCDAQHESVEAIIRILPRGLAGVQGNLWPHVNCRKHYLKKRDGQRWGEGPVICRGNIPDPNAKYGKSYCPLCKETWDRYYKIKNTYGEQQAKDSGITGNLSVDDVYVNVLILNDFVHPENNGQIKIWHAKTKQWDKVMAALPERNVNKNGQAKQQYTSTAKYVGIPWHVLSGAVFHLKGTWDTTKAWGTHKGAAVWDASEFDPTATPLAQNDEGIMQILNQCHDLSKYEIQPKTVEELEGVTRSFYSAYDGAPAMAADNNNNIAANGYPSYQQPVQYGQQQYAQSGQGGAMPASTPSAYVPPQPKTTVGNAGAFFNNPAAPNYGQSQQSTYVDPNAGVPVQQNPGVAPVQQSVFATPVAVPGAAPVQQSAIATPVAPQANFGTPAPQQAAPQYVPPAAPIPQPNQFAGAPAVGGTPAGTIIQVDDDADLPF